MGETKMSKPLFELLGDRRANPGGGGEEPPRSSGEPPSAGSGRRVVLPEVAVWAGAAVVLGLLVLTWAIAYQMGHGAGRAAMAEEQGPRELGDLEVREPGISSADTPEPTEAVGENDDAGSVASILTVGGRVSEDPRLVDTNYLELATLTETQARDAIEFLSGEGVRVIGVELDDGRVTLYSLEVAIESGKWATMRARGEAHQREMARLGARWQREHRGVSDFSGSYYRKFTGEQG